MNNHNDDDNDDDIATARRATPSSSIANPDVPGEGSSRQDVHRALTPNPQTEGSWLRAAPPRRVGSRVYPHPRAPGVVHQITTSPSTQKLLPSDLTAHQQIIKGQVPVPTCVVPTYVVPTCANHIDFDPVCVPIETEVGKTLSNILLTAGTELARISKTAETEPC